MAKTYKLQHDKPNCIGCGACSVIAQKFWAMDDEGKSNIINGAPKPNGWEEKVIDEKDFEQNMEAAQSCPVEVIHIIDNETNKKVV